MNQTLPLIDETDQCLSIEDPDAGFGALETATGLLPLKAMNVHSRITGLACTLTLSQTFVNAYDQHLEATYIFPLPSRAAVTKFRLKVADRVIEGQLKERQEAREEYEQAIHDGHRAALAEEDRPSVFNMKVGNIMPGETAEVELELSGPLTYFDGEAEFRFPFVVAPRYIPGLPLDGEAVGNGASVDTDAVPDASRITPPVLLPGFPNPVQLSLTVELDGGGLPVSNLRSSLHAVSTKTGEGEVQTISLYPGERLNRDFILRFNVAAESVRTHAVIVPDADGDEGTFQLTLVPPAGAAAAQARRDVIFILDRSGSMEGWKMVCARRAIGRMVDTLTERDRFAVLAFDTTVDLPPGHERGSLSAATDRNRFRTIEWLGQIDARGGTEMAEPLLDAVNMLADSPADVDRIVVLVTDGQVGNEDQILQILGKRIETIRMLTLGIDRAVNEGFLRQLAAAGGGHCELIESEDRLDDVMDRTHRRIATPILSSLQIHLSGATLVENSITPRRLPDLFAGTPAVIAGRYRNLDGKLRLDVNAEADGKPWNVAVDAKIADNPVVGHIWARGHIRDMEDLVAGGRAEVDLESTIIDTSLRFGVLCRYTAFVAVDKSAKIDAAGKPLAVTQPVEPAEGWDMLKPSKLCSSIASSAGLGPSLGAMPAPASAELRCGAPLMPQQTAGPAKRCRSGRPGIISNLMGLVFDDNDAEAEEEPEVLLPTTPADLDDALQQLADIIENLQQALTGGTENLAQALFEYREELGQLATACRQLGGNPDLVAALEEIAAALESGRPDSAATIKLWERLQDVRQHLP